MKLPTIKSARSLALHRVEVIWSTGRIDKVDVGAALKGHAGFKYDSLVSSRVCRKPRSASDKLQPDDAMKEKEMVMAARSVK